MVVSGLPEPLETHAERIANTALGLQLVAREVPSPYDYGDKSKNVKVSLTYNYVTLLPKIFTVDIYT